MADNEASDDKWQGAENRTYYLFIRRLMTFDTEKSIINIGILKLFSNSKLPFNVYLARHF